MLYMITGGSASGKSEYAEKLAVWSHKNEYKEGNLYYLATMYPYDKECKMRILKHQRMRREKGFTTVECFYQLESLALEIKKEDVILLECMSNLLANELYLGAGQIEESIKSPIIRFAEQAGHVILVTNEVFSDGMDYEKETQHYISTLGKLNAELGRVADCVVEIVCSIPVVKKGGLPW